MIPPPALKNPNQKNSRLIVLGTENIQQFIPTGRNIRIYRIGCLWATTLRSRSEALLVIQLLIENLRPEKLKSHEKNRWINGCKKQPASICKVFEDTETYWKTFSLENAFGHFIFQVVYDMNRNREPGHFIDSGFVVNIHEVVYCTYIVSYWCVCFSFMAFGGTALQQVSDMA